MKVATSIQPGLERITRLLDKTPLPWRAIHVGGTNGKGSVCVYISAMLDVYNTSAYRKTTENPILTHARFTSPHLVHLYDGITINQVRPRPRKCPAWHEHMLAKNEDERIGASEFEILTATAFECFTRYRQKQTKSGLDIAVVEVGMGGRDDATNIIGQSHHKEGFRAPPFVTAFTKIGLDHQEFLGNTLAEITRNKAGIMKPDVPVVFDTSNDEEVVRTLSEEAGDARLRYNVTPIEVLQRYTIKGSDKVLQALKTKMDSLAPHTAQNLALAFKSTWATLQQLSRVHSGKKPMKPQELVDLIVMGCKMLGVHEKVSFPGRLQTLSIKSLTQRPSPILLDGAHNEQSAQVLAGAVNTLRQKESAPVTWVLAASSTKDVRSVLKHILHDGDIVFAVRFGPVKGMPWVTPMPAADILAAAKEVADVTCFDCEDDVLSALQDASSAAGAGPMVVAGSLYLVGDVHRILEQKRLAPGGHRSRRGVKS